MDDFREWLSDNLRYILLGLAIIIVLVIAFFAVRFVSDRLGDSSDNGQTEAVTEAPASETTAASETEAATEAESTAADSSAALQTDNAAVQEAVTQYYNAVAAKDFDALQTLGDVVGDTDRDKINSNPIESYNNISVYYKQGLTDRRTGPLRSFPLQNQAKWSERRWKPYRTTPGALPPSPFHSFRS